MLITTNQLSFLIHCKHSHHSVPRENGVHIWDWVHALRPWLGKCTSEYLPSTDYLDSDFLNVHVISSQISSTLVRCSTKHSYTFKLRRSDLPSLIMSSENLTYYSCGHHFWGGGREEPGRPDLSSDWTRDPGAVAARLSKPHPCENCGKCKSSPTGERTLPFVSDFVNVGGTKALDNYSNSIRVPKKSIIASSATGFETRAYIASPLRNLLARYYTLDALSRLTPEVINGCLDSILGEPPSRPLVESVASVYVNIPRSWLAISRMKGDLHTDVLHKVLGILSDAQEYTHSILDYASSIPTLRDSEQDLMDPILTNCIRARKLVIDMLHLRIQAHLVGRTNEKQETVLDNPASHHSWSWESPVRLQSLISIGLLKLRMMFDPLEEGKNRIVWTCVSDVFRLRSW